jgi:transcriptional regulator with XRE-family HTH domain
MIMEGDAIPNEMTIGDRIKRIRHIQGLTQREVADAAGLHHSTLNAWEVGINKLRYEWQRHRSVVARLATVLGVTSEEIWGEAALPAPPNAPDFRPDPRPNAPARNIASVIPVVGAAPSVPQQLLGASGWVAGGQMQGAPPMEWPLSQPPEALKDAAGLIMRSHLSDTIPAGSRVGVTRAHYPVDGAYCLINQDGAVFVGGTFMTPEGWVIKPSTKAASVALTGEVVGLVVMVERPSNSTGFNMQGDVLGVRVE